MRTSEPRRTTDEDRPHGRNGRGTTQPRDDSGRAREAARWAGDEDLPSRRRLAAQDHGYERPEGYQGGQSGWSRHGAYEDRTDDQGDRRGDPRASGGPHVGKGPRGYRRGDERIAEDINERLTAHADVDAEDIAVAVANGEVTLTGTVDSRRSKRIAEDIAADVPGVRDVQNQLRVRKNS